MGKIVLEIKDCSKCPFCNRTVCPTSDSFERPQNWYCSHEDVERDDSIYGKKIAEYVEWHDEIDIPDWCPIKLK